MNFQKKRILSALNNAALGDSLGSVIYGMEQEEIAKKYDLNNIHAFSDIIGHISTTKDKISVDSGDLPDIDVNHLPQINQNFKFTIANCSKLDISYFTQIQLFILESVCLYDAEDSIWNGLKKWYMIQDEPFSLESSYLCLQPELNERKCNNTDFLDCLDDIFYPPTLPTEPLIEKIQRFIKKIPPKSIILHKIIDPSLIELTIATAIGLSFAIKEKSANHSFVAAYKVASQLHAKQEVWVHSAMLAYITHELYNNVSLENIFDGLMSMLEKFPNMTDVQKIVMRAKKKHVGSDITFKADIEEIINQFETLRSSDSMLELIILLIISLNSYNVEVDKLIEVFINGSHKKVFNWDSRVMGLMAGFYYGMIKEKSSIEVKQVNVHIHIESLIDKIEATMET